MRKLLNNPWFVAAIAVSATVLCTWSVMDFGAHARETVDQFADLSDDYLGDEEDEATYGLRAPADHSLPAVLAAISVPETPFDPFAPREGEVLTLATRSEQAEEQDPGIETATLAAIWVQGNVALALVNNRICEAGTNVGDLQVQAVDTDGIWVTHPEGRDFLPLGGSVSYKPGHPKPTQTTLALNEG